MILGQQNRRRIPLARERQRLTSTSVLSDAISLLIAYLLCDHSCAIRRSRLRQPNILHFRNHVHRLQLVTDIKRAASLRAVFVLLFIYLLFIVVWRLLCAPVCCAFHSSDYFTQAVQPLSGTSVLLQFGIHFYLFS